MSWGSTSWRRTASSTRPRSRASSLHSIWPTRRGSTLRTASSTHSSGSTGTRRARPGHRPGAATPRTGARASSSASAGTRRRPSSPARSDGSTRTTVLSAICAHGDGHGETKTVHGVHGVMMDLLALTGGFTQVVRNADSWEGWYWGTKHVWGNGENGLCLPADNMMNDVTQHTDMLVHIGSDLETTPWGFSGQFPTNVLYFWQQAGQEADLRLARPQLLGGRPRGQMDPHPPQHRRGAAPCHRLHLDGRGDVRQGVRRHPRRGLRQVRGLRAGPRGRRCPRPRNGRRPSAACPSGPSRPWPRSGPGRSPPSSTSTAAPTSAARTLMSLRAWRPTFSACRAWGSPASTSTSRWAATTTG